MNLHLTVTRLIVDMMGRGELSYRAGQNLSVSRFSFNVGWMIPVFAHKAEIGVELMARTISLNALFWMRSRLTSWVPLAEPYTMEP